MRLRTWLLGLSAIGALACGDDSGSNEGGSGSRGAAAGSTASAAGGGATAGKGGGTSSGAVGVPQAKNSCYAQCDAQDKIPNCDLVVSLQQCKTLCDGIVMGTKAECLDEFSAYYDCTVRDGFRCAAGFASPNSTACDDEQDSFDACANGPGGTKCEGQNANGVCPQVACPCPEGTKMVSGVDTGGSGCKCLDSVTCKDLFCD